MSFAGAVLIALAAATSAAFSCTQQASTASTPSATRTYMFGNNFYGQLGFADNNTVTPTFTYIGSQTTTRNSKLTGGFMTSAAILAGSPTNTTYFSGDGTSGQLGFGPAYESAFRRFYPPVESLPWLDGSGSVLETFSQNVVDVCTGWAHSCVLLGNPATTGLGKVMCSGANNLNQLGVGTFVTGTFSRFSPVLGAARSSSQQSRTDTDFNASTNFGSIYCGADHTLAVTIDGTQLWGWGSNQLGQLGQGAATSVQFATQISLPGRTTGDTIRLVAAGYAYTIVVMNTGTVYVMGSNSEQQLGIGSTPALYTTPTRATGTLAQLGSSIRLLRAGGSHVVMVAGASATNTVANRLYTWGEGTLGQLGQPVPDGSAGQRWYVGTPTAVPSMSGLAIDKIAAGMKHTLVLDTCGEVYTFGSDAFGQLGLGGSTAAQNFRRLTPTVLPARAQWNLKVYDVAAGAFHSGLIVDAS